MRQVVCKINTLFHCRKNRAVCQSGMPCVFTHRCYAQFEWKNMRISAGGSHFCKTKKPVPAFRNGLIVEMAGVEPASRTLLNKVTTLIAGVQCFMNRCYTCKVRFTIPLLYHPPVFSGKNIRGLLARTEAQARVMPSGGFRVSASPIGRWLIN